MSVLYPLARMTTATTGTGTITLGSAVSGYLTFALAGVSDAEVVSYGIRDGANSEVGTGTYTSTGTTLTRTVSKSTNSDAAISLSGSAEVFLTPLPADIFGQTSDEIRKLLHTETLSSANLLDKSSLSQAYDHLYIRALLQSDASAGADDVYLFLNNDTTLTNYYYNYGFYYNGVLTGGEGNAPLIKRGATGATSPTGNFGYLEFLIPYYTNTSIQKNVIWRSMGRLDANQAHNPIGMITWENTSAVTQITTEPDGYATDKFAATSRWDIFGIRAIT